jgi:hypothetical protein
MAGGLKNKTESACFFFFAYGRTEPRAAAGLTGTVPSMGTATQTQDAWVKMGTKRVERKILL